MKSPSKEILEYIKKNGYFQHGNLCLHDYKGYWVVVGRGVLLEDALYDGKSFEEAYSVLMKPVSLEDDMNQHFRKFYA